MAVTDVWCHVTVFEPDGSPLGRWTLRGSGAPDVEVVNRIARLRLAASSFGGTALLTEVAPHLRELLELVGLGELCREPGREAECREEAFGVLERVETDDPPG